MNDQASGTDPALIAQVLHDALENSNVAILILDQKLRLCWSNAASNVLLGGARGEFLDRDFRKVLAGRREVFANPKRSIDILIASYDRGEHLAGVDCRLQLEDGERWLEYSSQPITSGELAGGRVETFSDVSDQRRVHGLLEEQLHQSQKMEAIGRLAGGVAHDFNNLLTAINGYSQLLERMVPDGAATSYVQEIRKAGKRAAEMTSNLLHISRRQIVHPEVIACGQLLADHENLLQKMIGEDVRLTLRPDLGVGSIKVDRGQIEQVILNLAVNARDAMPTGGDLLIAASNVDLESGTHEIPAGAYVLLEIRDTGSGIPGDVLPHIFEPLFTTKEKGKGTGFGLAMAYATITRCDGFIQVESTPGKGTSFRMFLPRLDEEPEPTDDDIMHTPPPIAGGDERVLLVEDNDSVRSLVQELLEQKGYSMMVARDAHEALELLDDGDDVDLVITDVVMPAVSGPDLARRLQAHFPHMRFLFISGYNDTFVSQHGLNATHDVLLKPFEPESLAAKVREILDRPETPA